MTDIFSGVLAILLLLIIISVFIVMFYFESICNKKEKEFLKTLDDHEIALIHRYLQNRKLNINDLKRKKVDSQESTALKEVKDEDK